MAGHLDDPSQWRLHSNNGVVPFKLLEVDGGFEPEQGNVNMKALIPSDRLVDFLVETFPPSVQIGNLTVPQSSGLPGLPGLTARRVTFKSFVGGKPVDPFGFDPAAPDGTYSSVVEVNVEYGLNRVVAPDENDPTTWLEISATGNGEFLHTTAPAGRWQRRSQDPADTTDDTKEPGKVNNPRLPGVETGKDPIRQPVLPINVVVPQTEWTVKWNSIPYQYFWGTLIYRIRWCIGRVNSIYFPLLGMEPECLLFTGWSYNQQYTWRDGFVGRPPVSLELKFLEKRIIWNNLLVGHNHFWRPGKGWEYLLMDGISTPTYAGRDLSVLYRI